MVLSQDRRQEVARGLGLGEGVLRKRDAEYPVDTNDQLGTPEAVDAEVAVEPAVECRCSSTTTRSVAAGSDFGASPISGFG
jgi:hypothetical protein